MAILSGNQGLRGFNRFAQANAEELTEVLDLKHGVPSYSTFQALLSELDDEVLSTRFITWVRNILPNFKSDSFIALDGKAIKATGQSNNTILQNFVFVVNAFGHQSGLVYGMKGFNSGKAGEAEAVRDLIKQLGLRDKVFTLDALHTQKKHLT